MRLSGFLRDRAVFLTVNFLGILILSGYLYLIGNSFSQIGVILLTWILVLLVSMAASYVERRSYFGRLWKIQDTLEQKYLLPEIMDRPFRAEDREYYQLLRASSRGMLEEITSVRNERSEYKEYIESWVHEVKTPIAAMKLTSENVLSSGGHSPDAARKVLAELEKTENYVEQVLFYARSENVEKDYLIKEIPLKAPVNAVIVRNKQLLIQNRVAVSMEALGEHVYSDGKWIEFILNQIIGNAVKYRRPEGPEIRISAREESTGVALELWDNGKGIAPSDLPRIFEKGFTGQNGRIEEKSTGIGLYLCHRLCGKLGLSIRADSVQGEFTAVTIFFPKGKFVKLDEDTHYNPPAGG